jgi:antitoxin ParD1/3/4
MNMTSINVSLPESLKQFVEERADSRGCGTADEYLRTLIREEQTRRARESLDAKLLEGLQSPTSEMTDAGWAELREEVLARSPEPCYIARSER